jgi:hypothetical protein
VITGTRVTDWLREDEIYEEAPLTVRTDAPTKSRKLSTVGAGLTYRLLVHELTRRYLIKVACDGESVHEGAAVRHPKTAVHDKDHPSSGESVRGVFVSRRSTALTYASLAFDEEAQTNLAPVVGLVAGRIRPRL